jgi:chemotaxis protein CheX
MDKILLIDCSTELTQTVSRLLEEKVAVQNETFGEIDSVGSYRMVILETGESHEEILQKIRQLRHACRFRNVPVVLIKNRGNHTPIKRYVMAGATEVLSLDDPLPACRQILQGCLIPGRQPLVEEKEYLTPFIQSTQTVLKKMASVKAKFQEVYFSNDFRIFGEISGIIGLSGEAEGTVVITFYWDFARKIIAQMMNVQEDKIDAEFIHDGAGEIVNMISGVAKKSLVGRPYHFELSLPTVVIGSGHQIGHPDDASIAVLVFDVDSHSFAVQVCLKPKKMDM